MPNALNHLFAAVPKRRVPLRAVLGLLLSISLATVSAAEVPTLVESAFARAGASAGVWGYTMKSVEDGKTTVERFDPAGPVGGWTLVTIDGKTPSKKQLQKYGAKSETRESRDHPGEIEFRDIVDVDSIVLAEETTTSATFRFDPAPDDSADDDSAYLDGIMVIDKTERLVTSIELANTDTFSPATGIKINKMRVRMEFGLDKQGRFVLRELSQSVDGRLFGIKRLRQASTVTYSDFASPN